MERSMLRGRWDIISWQQEYDDGRKAYPLGENLKGFVEYGESDMFLVIERSDRAGFTGGQWSADAAEKAEAYDGYLTYAGTYDVEGDMVLHRVKFSLFPNWEGGVQRRRAELKGDTLRLVARLEDGTSEARTAILEWRRQQGNGQ